MGLTLQFAILTLAVSGCVEGNSVSEVLVKNGQPDSEHDFVVRISLKGGDFAWCSAVAIDAHQVLTNAHCFRKHGTRATYDGEQASEIVSFGGSTIPTSNEGWAKEIGKDIAIVSFSESKFDTTVAISSSGPVDGATIKLVGFGKSFTDRSYGDLRVAYNLGKLYADGKDGSLVEVASSGILVGIGEQVGEKGDSGGAWLDNNGRLVAIHSGTVGYGSKGEKIASVAVNLASDGIRQFMKEHMTDSGLSNSSIPDANSDIDTVPPFDLDDEDPNE